MQKILIIGYLGRDPELKYSPQGAVIAQFSIASTERWKDKNGDSRNAPSGSAGRRSGGARKSPASISTKATVLIWKAASAPSIGGTRIQAETIRATWSTSTAS